MNKSKVNGLPIVDQRNVDEKNKKINNAFKTLLKYKLTMPFAIGSGKEIQNRMRLDGFGANHSRRAINRLVNSRRYLQKILDSEYRYHLDGTISEPITDDQRVHAFKRLSMK